MQKILILLVGLGLTSGCALWGKKPEPCETLPLEVFLKVDKTLNRNQEGRSMPVEIQVLALKERTAFAELNAEQLRADLAEPLGPSLLQAARFTVFPGEDKIHTLDGPLETKYIGIVALFREMELGTPSQIIDIEERARRCKKGDLHIQVRGLLKDNNLVKVQKQSDQGLGR